MSAVRRIAAHLLWQPVPPGPDASPCGALLRHPLVTLSPATEFYAGLLLFDFPADYRTAFATLQAAGRPLPELLPGLLPAAGGCTVVVSGLDYETLRLTPRSQILRI